MPICSYCRLCIAKKDFNKELLKSFLDALELSIKVDIYQQDISAKWSIREGVRSGEIILDQFGNDIKSIDVALGFLVSRSQGKKNAVLGPLSKIEQKYEIELIEQFSQLYSIQFYLIGWNNQADNIENVKCFNSNEALIDYLNNINLDGSDFLGLGTELKYYIEEGQSFNDITPIRNTTSAGDITFAATNGKARGAPGPSPGPGARGRCEGRRGRRECQRCCRIDETRGRL